jgi:hypothetical protein
VEKLETIFFSPHCECVMIVTPYRVILMYNGGVGARLTQLDMCRLFYIMFSAGCMSCRSDGVVEASLIQGHDYGSRS